MGHCEGSPEREDHSNTGLPKKDRNTSNKQPAHTSTRTKRTIKTKARVNRRKKIIKIGAELNDIDHRQQTQGPWAEYGPPPSFIQPSTLLLPSRSAQLFLNCSGVVTFIQP